MLNQPTDFPHNGAAAFLAGSADPVTIIRRNDDGTALVRRDARRGRRANRDASGNTTVDFAELHPTADDAALAGLSKAVARRIARENGAATTRSPRRAAGTKPARARPGDRSGPAGEAGGNRREDGAAEAASEGKGK